MTDSQMDLEIPSAGFSKELVTLVGRSDFAGIIDFLEGLEQERILNEDECEIKAICYFNLNLLEEACLTFKRVLLRDKTNLKAREALLFIETLLFQKKKKKNNSKKKIFLSNLHFFLLLIIFCLLVFLFFKLQGFPYRPGSLSKTAENTKLEERFSELRKEVLGIKEEEKLRKSQSVELMKKNGAPEADSGNFDAFSSGFTDILERALKNYYSAEYKNSLQLLKEVNPDFLKNSEVMAWLLLYCRNLKAIYKKPENWKKARIMIYKTYASRIASYNNQLIKKELLILLEVP